MKKSAYLLILFSLLSCTHSGRKIGSGSSSISCKQVKNASSNTPVIVLDSSSNLTITQPIFKKLLIRNPELNKEITAPPDIAYAFQSKNTDFQSEQGQDEYYLLYAYLLKARNGKSNYQAQRKNLINIYTAINSIFETLAHGGTYFGHQYLRIPGYAEYSVSLCANTAFAKRYTIDAQKNLYIKSLRQLISDEISVDREIAVSERMQVKKDLFKTVDRIGGLITNYFYLKRAQEFQSSNY